MRQAVLIARDACFSPHNEAKDEAIIRAVATRLQRQSMAVALVAEDASGKALQTIGEGCGTLWLSMGRHEATLAFLHRREQQGMTVVNSTRGVRLCTRRGRLEDLMRREGIPMPPDADAPNDGGYWLKRADATAQCAADVVFAADSESRDRALRRFIDRGIRQVSVCGHVRGDVVKFYGVQPRGFFRTFYPTDDGDTKFDDEQRNGPARHYSYDVGRLQAEAQRLSALAGVPVYGGDAIVRPDGTFCIVDFNDWPSFARCRDEAADAIVEAVGCKG